MSARRHALLAAVGAGVGGGGGGARGGGPPPARAPPVEGSIIRTRTDPWLLLGATLSAGVAMVSATVAVLRMGTPRPG